MVVNETTDQFLLKIPWCIIFVGQSRMPRFNEKCYICFNSVTFQRIRTKEGEMRYVGKRPST